MLAWDSDGRQKVRTRSSQQRQAAEDSPEGISNVLAQPNIDNYEASELNVIREVHHQASDLQAQNTRITLVASEVRDLSRRDQGARISGIPFTHGQLEAFEARFLADH